MFKVTFASALRDYQRDVTQTPQHCAGNAELARIKSEYADVLALQGTAKPRCSQSLAYSSEARNAIDKTESSGRVLFQER